VGVFPIKVIRSYLFSCSTGTNREDVVEIVFINPGIIDFIGR
jgi:hypothetical protein